MADPPAVQKPPVSPISQLLHNLGMTRDDLTRRSDQMRQFLTTENANSLRAFVQEHSESDSAHTPVLPTLQIHHHSRSLSLADASATSRDTPPPVTPIKTEPVEPSTSLRRYDSMEAVIERQNRRSKKQRRYKRERETSPAPPPTPSRSMSRARSSMSERASRRVLDSDDPYSARDAASQDTLPPPITPRTGRYYRDNVLHQSTKSAARQDVYIPRTESPSPSRSRRSSVVSSRSFSNAPESQVLSFPPVTPRRSYYRDSLASSSPAMSTPSSSPSRHIVNIVSSPGPMGPAPAEEEYDELPFKLPAGPYSSEKPDLPYAALIGQAILSSPGRRLTLQEIYDWITIVYPYFKRNEQTWMNSIRHVLSTTIVFRKVQRDRAEGRTLWAIWDRDLECFANGGFRKEHCAEMQEQKARYTSKKRAADLSLTRKAKRSKKTIKKEASTEAVMEPAERVPMPQMGIPLSAIPGMSFAPLFPHPRPGVHHQPYYPPFAFPPPPRHGHTLPAGVIFPTLPPGSAYQRIVAGEGASANSEHPRPSTSASSHSEHPRPSTSASSQSQSTDPFLVEEAPPSPTPPLLSSSSSISMPDLIPNCSSSSPSNALGDSTQLEDVQEAEPPELELDFGDYIVDHLPEEAPVDALPPGVTLLNSTIGQLKVTEKGKAKASKIKEKGRKGKDKAKEPVLSKKPALPPPPESPTLARRSLARILKLARPSTPPPKNDNNPGPSLFTPLITTPRRPSTPPRKSTSDTHQLSAMRTPLSHFGVHMSPSPSLAYYKSHLNPPPPSSIHADDNTLPVLGDEHLRTPSRRRASSSNLALDVNVLQTSHLTPFAPATPRKISFASTVQESPFRTPGRGIFDPHDPSALLDEELTRLGAQSASMGLQESPAGLGLFARGRGMLYESPDASSPGRWTRMW
ncbi:hypothetical protein EW146_g5730 [Bondarzewia mesenterica]|uniref:Fork-head domain-containing protein n=1 Tax=Bondarzewia mesenterica TaxID=1095465 RepID=A0A4S4LRL6_9AGAM|nr:hypothetical protein EW146_g5730 [Bondarzewia mesenterica]